MEIELLNQDIQNYLIKYTRFMSKKVYITKKMYDNFVNSYEYIYESASESIINYDNDKYYNKLLEIKEKGLYALKLHNKKYLDGLYDKFANILSNKLSKKEKLAILCDEDVVIVDSKNLDNRIEIIKEKVSYLRNVCNVSNKNICIIVDDNIKDKFIDIDVDIFNFKEFGSLLCNDSNNIISNEKRYQILSSYIKDILYVDKKKFKKFYEVFKDKLYLDADSLDFETFRDYHSYMFKRKLRDGNKNVNDFVKELIINRRKELKSILDEVYDNGILVDIANTLFCSGINYEYYSEEKSFLFYNDDISYRIVYIDKKCDNKNDKDNIIYLYSDYNDGTNACEHLIYELVKRRYPIEKKSYEELYDVLKNNMIDCYFSRFINEIIIPYIDMINKNGYEYLELSSILEGLTGNVKKEFEILLEIYEYYFNYLNEYNLIDEEKFINMVRNNVSDIHYKYLLVIGNDYKMLQNNIKSKLFVVDDKRVFPYSYLMSNVKLFCDFKKYLNYKKIIPIIDVYYGDEEIEKIAIDFTSKNIDRVCNVYGDTITNKKKVEVYIYDDSNSFKSNLNCNYLLNSVISNISISKNKKIMIMGRDIRDKDSLTLGNYFKFSKKNTIICNDVSDKCLEYCFMDGDDIGVYETGILIHPMDDKYGFKYDYLDEDVISLLNKNSVKNYDWEKRLFYMAISRVKNKLYVIVPKSKVSKFVSGIANHNEVMVKKEVFSCD